MKRKPQVPAQPPVSAPEVVAPEIVAPGILESARRAVESERRKPAAHCIVCGADATPNSTEQLCWVCRRLKISAWRDVEQQAPAQE